MNSDIAIKVENLSKFFTLHKPQTNETGSVIHELCVIKDISFEIKKGENVGIIGPNGGGKSTLLKILAGITKPTSGKVTIKGKVASILDIGAGFHPELSGRENVFLNGQIHGFSKKEIEAKFDEIVVFSGIEKFIDEPVKNYSNGMYLRLAFSIMAHLDFDVYLFDEVMNVGDTEFGLKVRTIMETLKNKNKTIVTVSHNPQELKNSSIFIKFENGKINELSKDIGVLFSYIEKNTVKKNLVLKDNTFIRDFSNIKSPKELQLIEVGMFHNQETTLRTDIALNIKIQYEQTSDDVAIIPVISLTDILGNILLSSSPIISSTSFPKSEKGMHTLTCVIPPNLLGYRTYGVNLYFIINDNKNISVLNFNVDNKGFNSDIFVIPTLFHFKPSLFINDLNVTDLNNLNIENGLLPIFDWFCN